MEEREQRLMEAFFTCAHLLHHRLHAGRDRGQGQDRMLLLLRQRGGMTQRALQEEFGVRAASVSELAGKLEAAGLIARQPLPEDRRNRLLTLTPAGAAVAEGLAGQPGPAGLFSGLEAQEQEALLSTLEKLSVQWAAQLPGREGQMRDGTRSGRRTVERRRGQRTERRDPRERR